MPTGYTSDLYDGKEQSFPAFAMECARAFGALILMRDEARGATIPDEFQPSDYHKTHAATARDDWAIYTAMSLDVALETSRVEYEKYWEARRDSEHKRDAMRGRYEAMLAEVEDWMPPTPDHAGLKKFMREQLQESIKFDCGSMEYYPKPPPLGEEWRAAKIARAEKDITYHDAEYAEEVERARERSDWVRALRNSLPIEVKS